MPVKHGRELSLHEQIELLRRFGETWPLARAAVACALLAAACVYVFTVSGNETLKVLVLFAGGVSALLALAMAAQRSGFRRAARATRTGRRIHGVLHLVVDRSDSESVVITGEMRDGPALWTLHFGRPLGWTPQSGDWPCKLVMLSDEKVPALVELDQGLLIPTPESHKIISRGLHDA